MYGKGMTTIVGGASVSVLPKTGAFRPLFIIGATLFVMGVLMIAITALAAIRDRQFADNSK